MAFTSPVAGWLPERPGLRHTTDGGITWSAGLFTRGESPIDRNFNDIQFANPRHGCTWSFGLHGSELWSTSDGGATWQQRTLPDGRS
jgi:photosystem II stability/assembly factor-like uncharacterized protein